MKRPPPEVISHFKPGRLTKAISGDSAETFIGDKVIVQGRDQSWQPYGELLTEMSKTILLPGLRFIGEPIVSGGRVWTAQRRLVASKPFYPAEDMIAMARIYARPVFAQLDYLARIGPADQLAKLPESASTLLQLTTVSELKRWAEKDCPLKKNPLTNLSDEEPESEIVFSHGDPSVKNTLLTPFGPALIDFEAIALLPRHKDYTHMNAFLLKRSPVQDWHDLIYLYWPFAHERLPGWRKSDWRQSVIIYLLRELLAWPLEDEKQQLMAWRGLAKLVNNSG